MLRFEPHYKTKPWGGRGFAKQFGRILLPKGPIGESWELGAFEAHHSRVSDGPYYHRRLQQLWQDGVLGGSTRGPFPFLLKWLDTADVLSVQVHPSASACAHLGFGSPKLEAWYVVHANPGAYLFLGHKDGLDPKLLRSTAADGSIDHWLHRMEPTQGDMLLVPPGTLHAIGPGFILLEVQQPSDTTFRVYDWGRITQNGAQRALHLDAACSSVHFEDAGPHRVVSSINTGAFVMKKAMEGAMMFKSALRVWVAGLKPVELESISHRVSYQLRPGDVVVAEVTDGDIRVARGNCICVTEAEAK